MKRLLTGIVAALLMLPAGAMAQQATTMDWTIDGAKREALVFAPTAKAEKHPLVFAFHGHGGNMQAASRGMHIQTLWPEAIVVYPQGLELATKVDPAGTKPGWQRFAGEAGDRDLKLFDAMLATLKQKFVVDDSRVYATGFSNGAIFSYLLWAERGQVIAAIAEVAGRLWGDDPADTAHEHPSQRRALLAIAGQRDAVDPFQLQKKSIENAKQFDDAQGPAQPAGREVCKLFPSSRQTPVETCIHPGAHFYPPWAPAETVQFFKSQQLPS
jgi:polyhydroxybutyrate depolymerase